MMIHGLVLGAGLCSLAALSLPSGTGSRAAPDMRGEAAISGHTGGQSCRFAIRAKNNTSLAIWIDLHDSEVTRLVGPALFRNGVKLEIQNQRLTSGQSMDRRYEAAGSCNDRRTWIFWVKIDRPSSSTETRRMVSRSTEGSGDRTIYLGNASTWGL